MSTPLVLHYPVRPYSINQKFGANNSCTENTPSVPIGQRQVVSKVAGLFCPIGYVELYPLLGMKGHTGMDLMATNGQPCFYSGPDGIVEEEAGEVERGLGLGIVTNDKFLFKDGTDACAKTRYWHFQSFVKRKGDKARTGDLIGYCDNTGLSSGAHLHLELKPVFRQTNSSYYNIFLN